MLPKILSYDEKLSIFGEPGFQILIRKAQIAAASSERESDYEMLADLLLHRAEQHENRERRLGISKAIEIVDQIDDLALIALSIVYAVSKYTPVSSNIHEGFGALNKLYGNYSAPPSMMRVPTALIFHKLDFRLIPNQC